MNGSFFGNEFVAFCATNSVSALVCLLAAILVCCLKLHTKVVYRLALYQVLSSLAFATVEASQIVNYKTRYDFYSKSCIAIGWLVVYTQSAKLLFTMWATLHLFFFSVCYKNLKRLEVLYLSTSLLVPAAVACVPLMTHSYGLSASGRCYVHTSYAGNRSDHVVLIEKIAIWDGPAIIILLLASVAMATAVIKLAKRLVISKMKYEPITDNDRFCKALSQMLPLAAFPILFFVYAIPLLIIDVYSLKHTRPSNWLALGISNGVFISLWSMTSGVTLLVHMCVARCGTVKRLPRARIRKNAYQGVNESHATYTV